MFWNSKKQSVAVGRLAGPCVCVRLAFRFCSADNSVIEMLRKRKESRKVCVKQQHGRRYWESWDQREGRIERWRRVQGELKGKERRERRSWEEDRWGDGVAWVEDLPVNCAVASRVVGARLSERAWNSTPRGSARVHTLSVQDPCPSVNAGQQNTSIYRGRPKYSHAPLQIPAKWWHQDALHRQYLHIMTKNFFVCMLTHTYTQVSCTSVHKYLHLKYTHITIEMALKKWQ